jgi:O-Antigen ligase.
MERASVVLIFFPVGIIISFFVNGASLSVLHQCTLVCLVIILAIFLKDEVHNFECGVKFLIFSGLISTISLLLQFFFENTFNSIYFAFLKPDALSVAENYLSKGYYFGFNYRPHIAAGSICFALAAIFFRFFCMRKKMKKRHIILMLCLFFALILTQKKGILLVTILTLTLVLILVYASKRQWTRALKIIGVVVCIGVVLYMYILAHPDNVMFYRITQFVSNFLAGEEFDSGRNRLYAYAISLFLENPILGIGWRQFAQLTVSDFNYITAHQVNFDYLQFLCEMGIVGFLLFLIPIITMLCRSIKLCRNFAKLKISSSNQWLIFFATYVQFFMVAYAFIEVPFYDIMYFSIYIYSCVIINNGWRMLRAIHSTEITQ